MSMARCPSLPFKPLSGLVCSAVCLFAALDLSWGDPSGDYVVTIPADGAPVMIKSWLVAAPFPSPADKDRAPHEPLRLGFERDYLTSIGGEAAAKPQPGTKVAHPDGHEVEFVPLAWETPFQDLGDHFSYPREVCGYLYAELDSPVEQQAFLHFATDDGAKIWVGGELIYSYPFDSWAWRSQHIAPIHLPAGRTPLLIKVDQGASGWGAIAEVYGLHAHREFVATHFPQSLRIEADRKFPNPGDQVVLRLANWPFPDPAVPIEWTCIDGSWVEKLAGHGPSASLVVAPGPPRIVRLRVRAARPQKGRPVEGESVLLVGGEAAYQEPLARFAAVRAQLGEPQKLKGHQRDAYALALYGIEKIERRTPKPSAPGTDVVEGVGLLLSGLEHLAANSDPYTGRTGLVEAAYLSDADGTAQPFTMEIPEAFSPTGSYALFLDLHGASGTHESIFGSIFEPVEAKYAMETIGVAVLGRGRYAGYAGLAEDDIVQVVAWMKAHYPIDPERVYLSGGSMGGSGAWRLGAFYADRFAGVMVDCGRPDLRTLPNLVNVPIYINQGSIDWLVSVANARLGVGIMRQEGVPVTYHEYAGIGHAVWPQVEKEGYLTRLATHRRVRDPDHICLVALHPRQAAQYWARIERWIDPHHPARLDARVLPDNVVRVETSNVEHLRLKPPVSLLEPGKELVWLIQGRRYSTPWSAAGDYEVQIEADSARVGEGRATEGQAATHPYGPGGLMELYRGEPLLIVYGTATSDAGLRQALSDFAAQASLWSAAGSSPMELGRAPVLADTAVGDAHLTSHNLLLIGGPGENALSARLTKKLPIREEVVDGALALRAFDNTFSMAGKGYGFLYPNPEHPQRLIYVLSAGDPSFYRLPGMLVRFYQSDPDNPDLVILRADSLQAGQWARTLRYDQDWKPLPNGPRAGRYPHSEPEFQEMVAETYRRAAQAPFALVRKASPEAAAPYDAQAGWEEISLLLPADPLLTCEATGSQLLGLADSKQDYWWTLFPIPDSSTVDRESLYRIAGSPDLMRALARSQFAPASIGIGADADHLRAVAREVWAVNEGQLLTPGHP